MHFFVTKLLYCCNDLLLRLSPPKPTSGTFVMHTANKFQPANAARAQDAGSHCRLMRIFTNFILPETIVSEPGMCTRPFRPRRDRDVGHFVRDETETETLRVRDETDTETFQLPRPWSRRVVKKIKYHKINWTSKHFVFVMLWDFAARACTMCIARYCCSIRPSVCSPSVTLRYRGRISWATSKIITLRSSRRFWALQRWRASLRGHLKNLGLTGVGCCFQQKTCIQSKIGPRLLLTSDD